jgi:hypothetical protein
MKTLTKTELFNLLSSLLSNHIFISTATIGDGQIESIIPIDDLTGFNITFNSQLKGIVHLDGAELLNDINFITSK